MIQDARGRIHDGGIHPRSEALHPKQIKNSNVPNCNHEGKYLSTDQPANGLTAGIARFKDDRWFGFFSVGKSLHVLDRSVECFQFF